MKAILVIDDMPTRCLECELVWDEINNGLVRCSNGRRLDENEDYIYKQKPSWCPLRPLPQKKEETFTYWIARGCNDPESYINGWNDCLDEIEGETE